MLISHMSSRQLLDITIIERVASILSLLGCLWIAVTFLFSSAFQKPINRLVFYASVGNIFTNCATIMSRDFVRNPRGVGCQVQAFFIQMFMPADAVWTLAMAANVWLTFYHKYDSEQLRALEKWYFLLCYGLPFIPAIIFCFVSSPGRGPVYGNAALWCWVSPKYEALRIACFYGPVWISIFVTVAIYLRAGKDIYNKRKQLRQFNYQGTAASLADPFTSCKTTEVMVTSEAVTTSAPIDLKDLAPHNGLHRPGEAPVQKPTQSYQVTVTSELSPTPVDDGRWSYSSASAQPSRKPSVADGAPMTLQTSNINYNNPPRKTAMEANTAALSYTKVAVLFFLAMMITWIPSSANRVFSVVHPDHVSLPLQFASAFVLPLQGFWNALIYTITSLQACKSVWKQIREGKKVKGTGLRAVKGAFSENAENGQRRRARTDKYTNQQSESMTELQCTRPPTKDCDTR